VYCGLARNINKEEIRQRIETNTITEVLNEVKVKKGDVIFIRSGTIHAIGAGILICEIQQNSNSTYRLYDYDRRDKFGNLRELHLEKALDVVDPFPFVKDNHVEMFIEDNEHFKQELLVQCKYFECFRYDVYDEVKIMADEASFESVVILNGSGTISVEGTVLDFKAGESFFVQAGRHSIVMRGRFTSIVTHV
jgi:mannose-6-phosphate isomerase class I